MQSSFTISPRTLLAIAIGILAFIAVWELRIVVLIIGSALIVATFMNGPIAFLTKLKIPRVIAAILVYLFLAALFGFVVYLLVPIFTNEVASFTNLLPKDSKVATIVNLITDPNTIKTLSNPENTKKTASIVSQLESLFADGGNLVRSSGLVITGVVNVILAMVIAFYFSIENQGIDRFLRLVTPRENEDYVVGLWHRVRAKISSWFKGQVILACVLGALTYVALALLGVPYALLLSLVALLFSIVPFGIVFATIPALAVAFIAGGLPLALLVLGIYVVLQQIENHVFQPLFVKRTTGLPPIVVIIALAAGTTLAGVVGLFVAVPVAVLLLELLSDHEKRRRTAPNSNLQS